MGMDVMGLPKGGKFCLRNLDNSPKKYLFLQSFNFSVESGEGAVPFFQS